MSAPAATSGSAIRYFYFAFAVTIFGLLLGGWLGWQTEGTLGGMASVFFVCCVLAVLEISLSFDNAIVNANRLKTMTPLWQKRFLTWGILIAVFGMRIVFPILVVVIAARIGPWEAVVLAASEPDRYAEIMHDAHLPIAAFGGTFLMMVALRFFFDEKKVIHWIPGIEPWAVHAATIRGSDVAFVLMLILGMSQFLHGPEKALFVSTSIWGLLTFLAVEVLGEILDGAAKTQEASVSTSRTAATGGLGAFLYLEVLDASFSFDGVIGAFALTQNLFIIAIGLGIGAMYVRSMTIMLVHRGTLAEYRYLEHGAFYAILVLSIIMYAQTLVEVPEVVTGLLGTCFIAAAFWASVVWRRREAAGRPKAPGTATD